MNHRRLDAKLAHIRDTLELLDQGPAITEEVLKTEADG